MTWLIVRCMHCGEKLKLGEMTYEHTGDGPYDHGACPSHINIDNWAPERR